MNDAMATTDKAGKTAARRSGFEAGAAVIRDNLKTMPETSGVYRMLSADGRVLYVGKARNLKRRVASYVRQNRLPLRLRRMVAQTRSMEIVETSTEAEALLLEANFIKKFMPPCNVLLRDDKSYPHILITLDREFPQLLKHRGARSRKGWYFGPFASAGAVNETIALLQRAFMLRNCGDSFFSNRARPCLQYHIKRCTAPCVGRATVEDYAEQAAEARDFLQGKSAEIQIRLSAMMQQASDAMDYETAALCRDRIKALAAVQARQDVNLSGLGDADVFAAHQGGGRTVVQAFFFRGGRNYGSRAYYPEHDKQMGATEVLGAFLGQFYGDKPPPPLVLLNLAVPDSAVLEQALSARAERKVAVAVPRHGDKRRLVDHAQRNAESALARRMADNAEQANLLARVADAFGLDFTPSRIEVYDNSHISGRHAVGCLIAAGADGFIKSGYRKFNVRADAKGDDFAMMREVLTRRFERLAEEDAERKSGAWPDLVLIDGGQGQLGVAVAVLEELGLSGITVVGIAKGPDRNAGKERFFMPEREPFSLPDKDPALYYLQRLRDEAHRFAIGTHRARRAKETIASELDAIAGVGAVRKRALLHHFGSARAVSEASLEELLRVKGISSVAAKRIHGYFHGES